MFGIRRDQFGHTGHGQPSTGTTGYGELYVPTGLMNSATGTGGSQYAELYVPTGPGNQPVLQLGSGHYPSTNYSTYPSHHHHHHHHHRHHRH
jgi:hypothetical protein